MLPRVRRAGIVYNDMRRVHMLLHHVQGASALDKVARRAKHTHHFFVRGAHKCRAVEPRDRLQVVAVRLRPRHLVP